MNEQIQLLINLQEKDTLIAELNEIIKNLPVKIQQWKEKYKSQEEELNQIRKKKEQTEKELRSNERRLQTIEDELKKFRARIYEVKTQKEMISLDNEIKKGEAEKSKLEDNILQLMETNDNLVNKIKSFETELEKELVELQKAEEETNRKIELNTDKLNTTSVKRNQISEKIRKDILSLYEKIRANKNNLAIVPVKNGACQGCFIKLPPQIINDLITSSEIIRCEACVRILYFKKD